MRCYCAATSMTTYSPAPYTVQFALERLANMQAASDQRPHHPPRAQE